MMPSRVLYNLVVLWLAVSAIGLVGVSAVPSNHVLKERQISREDFVERDRSAPHLRHEVVIAIQKLNLNVLEQEVLLRATPGHPKYQQWLSYDEVGEYITNFPAYERVSTWLQQENIEVVWTSKRKDYIRAVAPISKWEALLHTTFLEYEDRSVLDRHPQQKHIIHRAKEYYIPASLNDDIFAIFNTVQTPPPYHPKFYVKENPELGSLFRTDMILTRASSLRGDGSSRSRKSAQASSFPGYVTVSFLNSYYHIANNTGSALQQQSVFETSTEYFSTSDLQAFQESFDLRVQSAQSIGGKVTTSPCPVKSTKTMDCYEGNLDIQYIMGVSQVTASIYWWVSGTTTDPFVGWVTAMADEVNPPKANSASWGANEQLESVSIMQTFNNEALQLAAMGVTIVASTGDNGAAALNTTQGCQCNANSGSSTVSWASNSWTGKGYFPSFPATSPYVTAAGATMGPEKGNAEVACQSQLGGVITTGGGFSTYFSRPSWQSTAVTNYFSSVAVPPTAGYNPQGRGIPDLSLIGSNYVIVVGNTFQVVFGTSCVAPVIAAFVSLVNAGRASEGLSSIGWINPTLYSVGTNNSRGETTMRYGRAVGFKDITSGNNKCCASSTASKAVCCASGFTTSVGWDPVTGWGSVNFTDFAAFFDYDAFSLNASAASSGTSSGGSASASGSGISTTTLAIIVVVMVVAGATIGTTILCCLRQKSDSTSTAQTRYTPDDQEADQDEDGTPAEAAVELRSPPPISSRTARGPEQSSVGDTEMVQVAPSAPPLLRRIPPRPPPRPVSRPPPTSSSQSDNTIPVAQAVHAVDRSDRDENTVAAPAPVTVTASAAAVIAQPVSTIVIAASEVSPQRGPRPVEASLEDPDEVTGRNDRREEEERINMANPMRGLSNLRRAPSDQNDYRNSMERVQHLQRGLSLDRPQGHVLAHPARRARPPSTNAVTVPVEQPAPVPESAPVHVPAPAPAQAPPRPPPNRPAGAPPPPPPPPPPPRRPPRRPSTTESSSQ